MMPGMPDLSQILMQAQQMQADMQRAQASLAEAEVTGSAGSGLVTAVVNGSGDLLRLKIDPSVVDPADVETLALAALRCGGDSTGAEQDAITRELATAAIKATASRGVRALMVRTLPSTGRPSGTSRGVGSREECAHYCGLDPP